MWRGERSSRERASRAQVLLIVATVIEDGKGRSCRVRNSRHSCSTVVRSVPTDIRRLVS